MIPGMGFVRQTLLQAKRHETKQLLCGAGREGTLAALVCLICGISQGRLPAAFDPNALLWEIRLGTHQYTVPRVDAGQVFIGINDMGLQHPVLKKTGGGIMMCLDRTTGDMLWQLPIPRYMEGAIAPFHFNHWKCGVCSTPALEGKYLYIVGPRGDVLCLDRFGQADGNDGPFRQDAEYMGVPENCDYELTKTDGDIIWHFDMIKALSVVPHDVCGSSALIHGDYVYVCTSNGQDDRHKYVANPLAPSLIVLDKHTGRLVATDGELIGQRMFHGHWSSPVALDSMGKHLILFGGGDGILYAFAPAAQSSDRDAIQTLRKVWQYDCVPSDYRKKAGRPIPYSDWRSKRPEGPSEVIAIPTVHEGRVYVAIGQSPVHGPGQGQLVCVDGATGQEIWTSRRVGRSLSSVAIHRGLLYVSDYSGKLWCLDTQNGEPCWQHDLEAGVWTCSPVVADEKLYVSTEDRILWVLQAGRRKQVLSRSRLQSMGITPTIHEGILYFPTQLRLFALSIESAPQ